MKEKKGMSFKLVLLGVAIIPLIICALIVGSVSVKSLRAHIKEGIDAELNTAAIMLNEYFAYDIINNGVVDYEEYADHSFIESLESENIELTLFEGDTRLLTSIKNEDGTYNEGTQAAAEIYSIVGSGDSYSAEGVVIGGKEYFVYYLPIYDGNGKFWGMAFAGEPEEKVNSAITRVVMQIVVLSIILVVVLGAIIFVLASILSAMLVKTQNGIEMLAAGDLNAEFPKMGMVREFNYLIGEGKGLAVSLQDIIGKSKNIGNNLLDGAAEVAELSERSKEGTEQIASAMEDLANGATSMAQSVQSINEQVIEMGMSIDTISESTDNLVNLSNNIKAANEDAAEYINKVSDSSEQSVSAVHDISKQIQDTNLAVNNIKDAVDMISSIASQTNLLALNASIEAARAGEAGKGFAVVATEIKSLSEQSNSSAEEIKRVVNDIITQSERSVELSEEVANIITREQEYISDTQTKFGLLNTEIASSLEEINGIALKVKSLDEAKVSITDSVGDLSAISEENAASNEEVSASVSEILDAINNIADNSKATQSSASDLGQTMEYFK